ncbi:hypothetical protein SAMN06265337_0288 [Hymenobacter gelipurpurascens]|uniref:DUF3592 domain-containing protein n=1 Tax=Hymenobacter gelipurpurascens TaxID=89968 RepID=A0A212T3I8_9BACT|nr:DUF3592 domain-containing protein [Hymenobacter gelipurpurascens]SNC60579.1 hypothetical protein SAMN06265337_0288 [Hymenobacter gelipurpurascens]
MKSPVEYLITLAGGVALFWWGQHLWRQRRRLEKMGLLTTGVVVGHDYGPIVEFSIGDNTTVIVKPPISAYRRFNQIGERVSLYYNPDDPQDFVLNTLQQRAIPYIFLVGGAGFVIGGTYAYFS